MLCVDEHDTDFIKVLDRVKIQSSNLETNIHNQSKDVIRQSEDACSYKPDQFNQAVLTFIHEIEAWMYARIDVVTEDITKLFHFLREKHGEYFPSDLSCIFLLDNFLKEHLNVTETATSFNKSDKELEETNERLKHEINILEQRLETYRSVENSRITQMEYETRVKSEQHNADLENEIIQLRMEFDELMVEHKAATNKLESLLGRKTLHVQLYSTRRSDTLTNLETKIMAMLKEKLEREDLQIEFVQCTKQSDIQPSIPILMTCIAVSGLQVDVDNTIRGLTLTNKMALLIFHHKGMHALPTKASEDVLTGEEFSKLGGIFDMVFYTGKGFHNCQMNTTNFVSLVNFIKLR